MDIILRGFLDLSWTQAALLTLLLTHITILTVTMYLHRSCAHRAVEFHPALALFFRVWSWMTTGMTARQWASVHRKHHAKCETPEDPHSPQQRGLKAVLFGGVNLYRAAARDPEVIARYGAGTPNDKLEQFLESYAWQGMILMIALEIALFGLPMTLFIATAQLLWIPVWAAGVINGIGHYWGYRNHDSDDASRNIFPWGIFIGGEELHNNHHAFPSSAKLSSKAWEFDWGWTVIRGLSMLRLAKIKRVAPTLAKGSSEITFDTLKALAMCRFQAMVETRAELSPLVKEQLDTLNLDEGFSRKRFMRWFFFDNSHVADAGAEAGYARVLAQSPTLLRLRSMVSELMQTWQRANVSAHDTLEHFKAWCIQAETSGVERMARLAASLRRYQVAHA